LSSRIHNCILFELQAKVIRLQFDEIGIIEVNAMIFMNWKHAGEFMGFQSTWRTRWLLSVKEDLLFAKSSQNCPHETTETLQQTYLRRSAQIMLKLPKI